MPTGGSVVSRWANVTLGLFALGALAIGCGGGGGGGTTPPVPTPTPLLHLPQHVIVVVMENRTVDNLFQFLAGADTVPAGPDSTGGTRILQPVTEYAPYDPDHSRITGFLTDYNNGKVNGWNLTFAGCSAPPKIPPYPCLENVYGFVPEQEVMPYYQMAQTYAFASHVLQSNGGPSYPAHEYLFAGESGRPLAIAENPTPNIQGGCGNTTPGESVAQVDLSLPFPSNENHTIFTCVDFPTIVDLLDQAKISWKYYTPLNQFIWTATDQFKHLWTNPAVQAKVITPELKIFHDITSGQLPQVSYVIPHAAWSDHPRIACTNFPLGPDFVGALVDAVGQSQYWKSTAIVVTWDDWGGWFDHIKPVPPLNLPNDPYEYGFRVPLIAISPYAKPHFIDPSFRDFTSILHFIEDVYHLPQISPNSIERKTDDLFNLFQFSATTPRSFQVITTAHPPSYWAGLPSPLPSCIPPSPFPTPSGGIPSPSGAPAVPPEPG